ncbi:MAG TPA: NADH-quinone oxidoreductase subunit NuoN, partial [Gammaproteobacteria bacterium]|nr:NADH-quinone oxidoreductase subunit NuoN [Gammaproteobacteria bacterium]
MDFVAPEFMPAAPEIFVLGVSCLILALDVYLPERYRPFTYHLSQATLIGAAVLCIALYPSAPQVTFYGAFVSDAMSAVLKIFILLVTYFAFFYMRAYLLERNMLKGEYFVLGLFAVLGMMVLVSAHSMLTVYLGLELLSLCLYAMVALNRDSISGSEAAMKYFVLGALASGMLLYGMSLIYGVTGTLDLSAIRGVVAGQQGNSIILVLGLVFVLVGIAFKLGAVPFHMWVPDVYEGAPTPVTLFISSAPKMAAFGMLVRLLVDGLPGLQEDWTSMLAILAVLSMGIGNIVAIAQSNLKRMLAYSTIAHVGFLFLGIIAGSASGYAASMFYIITYALMSMGGFGMIIWLGRAGFEADRLDDFKGLNDRNPWFAFLMLILMLSMAGVPPFVGFWAKWSVLREVIAAGSTWLAVVGVAFAIIGLFYYLRVVRLMYFEKPEEPLPVASSSEMRVMMSTNALAILALGVYPGGLLALCVQ